MKVKLSGAAFPAFQPGSANPMATPAGMPPSQAQKAEAEQALEERLYEGITLMLLSAYQILNLAHLRSQNQA